MLSFRYMLIQILQAYVDIYDGRTILTAVSSPSFKTVTIVPSAPIAISLTPPMMSEVISPAPSVTEPTMPEIPFVLELTTLLFPLFWSFDPLSDALSFPLSELPDPLPKNARENRSSVLSVLE
jgi:hypothetical protein